MILSTYQRMVLSMLVMILARVSGTTNQTWSNGQAKPLLSETLAVKMVQKELEESPI